MKIIKLDKRHKLQRLGFTHAFKFENGFSAEDRQIILNLEHMLVEHHGLGSEENVWMWQWNNNSTRPRGHRIYYIGVRNEAIITQLLMML